MAPVIKHHKRLTLLVTGTWWYIHQRGSDAHPGAETPMLEITDSISETTVWYHDGCAVQTTTHFGRKKHHLPVLLIQQPKGHFFIGEKTLKI